MWRGAVAELGDHVEKNDSDGLVVEHGHPELGGKGGPHLLVVGRVILLLHSHSLYYRVEKAEYHPVSIRMSSVSYNDIYHSNSSEIASC